VLGSFAAGDILRHRNPDISFRGGAFSPAWSFGFPAHRSSPGIL